jgi:hypothetical protein
MSPPTRATADDPQQPLSLITVDLTHTHTFSHPSTLTTTRRPVQHPSGASHHDEANVA